MSEQTLSTGAENVHWDLTDLYEDVDDPKLDQDLEKLLALTETFHSEFAGQLSTRLGDALTHQSEIECLADKLMVYLFLRKSTDATNETIQQKMGQAQ